MSTRTEKIKETLNDAFSTNIDDIPTPKLKGYVKALSDDSELERMYRDYYKNIEGFTQDEMICNLCFVCSSYKDKIATVKTILAINTSDPSERVVEQKLNAIESITRSRFDNCQVRCNKEIMKFKGNSLG